MGEENRTLKERLKSIAFLILTLVVYMPDKFKVNEEKLVNGLEEYAIEIIKSYKEER